MSNPRKIHLVVLDTETGGFDPASACIIELAAQFVTIDGEARRVHAYESDLFHAYVLPDRPVSEQAAAVNGYSVASWAAHGAQGFHEVGGRFVDWLNRLPYEGLMWAGSNVTGFDLPFLRSDLARFSTGAGLPGKPLFSHRTLNTESLCFPLFARGEVDHVGIQSLRNWAGIAGEQHHNARDDVSDTVHVIRTYFEREQWHNAKRPGDRVAQTINGCGRFTANGQVFAFFNDDHYDRLVNDVAERMRETAYPAVALVAFRVVLRDGDEPMRIQYSLRSIAEGFDVRAVAKKLGGDGHAAAAGASVHGMLGMKDAVDVFRRMVAP